MLVEYSMGFIMVGETTQIKKHIFKKPEEFRKTIYLSTGIHGICDESEVENEASKKVEEELKRDGWGKDFSGWKGYLSVDECDKIQKANKDWYSDYDLKKLNILNIKNINEWKMEEIIKRLNGKQFAQFCIENGMCLYDIKQPS